MLAHASTNRTGRRIRGGAAVALLLMLGAGSSAARAATVNVGGPGASDSASCGDPGSPCATVPFAVMTRAAAGDTVRVAAGRYDITPPGGGGALVVDKPGLHLEGAQAGVDPATRTASGPAESTLVDGTPASGSYALLSLQADGITVDGFTIADNAAGDVGGAGILTGDTHSGYVITGNIITNNSIGLYLAARAPSRRRSAAICSSTTTSPDPPAGTRSTGRASSGT